MMLGNEPMSVRDDLESSRARVAEASSALPGYEARAPRQAPVDPAPSPATAGFYDTGSSRTMTPDSTGGFAAAYRAVTPQQRAQQPYGADQTARMDLPMDMQGTGGFPRVDNGGSTSGTWPVPTPPPVGEAPPSAYDPMQDTGYNIPAYGNSGTAAYRNSDVYDTGETNNLYGTYNPNDTYNSGPANQPPGESFDASGSGEPWNTPSGGYR
jgi:hypothetical protein